MISNSNSFGLRITGANGTVVQGNYFGTDPAGAAQAPNAVDIKVGSQSVSDLAVGTRIGGFLSVGEQASAECDGPCNVISGASTMIDLDGTSPHTEAANFTEIRRQLHRGQSRRERSARLHECDRGERRRRRRDVDRL